MSAVYKVGSFTKATTTGNQAVIGIGFSPKAILLLGTFQTAANTFEDGYRHEIGFAGSNLAGGCALNNFAGDGQATQDLAGGYDSAACYLVTTFDQNVLCRATIVSFDGDGFTINWSTNDASATLIAYLAFGGTDLSGHVDDQNVGSTGAGSVTFVPFAPTFALCIPCWSNTATSSFDFVDPAFGVTDGTNSAMITGSSRNTNPSNCSRGQRTDRLWTRWTDLAADTFVATFTSLNADGITFNTTVLGGGTTQKVLYLFIGGAEVKLGTVTQPATTGTQAITGVGFEPAALLLFSFGAAATTSPVDHGRYSVGITDGTDQRSIFAGEVDNVSPSRTARRFSTTKLLSAVATAATASSSTIEAECEIDSFDADGFTLDWTTADATAREIVYVAFGGGAVAEVFDALLISP
jgi:hypothetical protein